MDGDFSGTTSLSELVKEEGLLPGADTWGVCTCKVASDLGHSFCLPQFLSEIKKHDDQPKPRKVEALQGIYIKKGRGANMVVY